MVQQVEVAKIEAESQSVLESDAEAFIAIRRGDEEGVAALARAEADEAGSLVEAVLADWHAHVTEGATQDTQAFGELLKASEAELHGAAIARDEAATRALQEVRCLLLSPRPPPPTPATHPRHSPSCLPAHAGAREVR